MSWASISGHLSRRMLERYAHIRIDAKRQALGALDEQRGRVLPETQTDDDTDDHRDTAKTLRHNHVTV